VPHSTISKWSCAYSLSMTFSLTSDAVITSCSTLSSPAAVLMTTMLVLTAVA